MYIDLTADDEEPSHGSGVPPIPNHQRQSMSCSNATSEIFKSQDEGMVHRPIDRFPSDQIKLGAIEV
jgi:hypothetical protein